MACCISFLKTKSIFPSSLKSAFEVEFSEFFGHGIKILGVLSYTEKKCIDIAAKNVHHIHKKPERKLLSCLARFLICSNNMHTTLFTFDCKIQLNMCIFEIVGLCFSLA